MIGATAGKRTERNRMRRCIALLAAALLGLPASASWALELAEILAASRVMPPARVAFQEERHSPLFDEPLVLDGYLEYRQSGVLNKIIESPFAEAFLIEDGKIRLERDGETRQVALDRSEELATIIGAIEAILSGEAGRLESLFDVEVSGTAAAWSLELTPRSRRVGRSLSRLNVSGDDDSVAQIKIDLRDGEWQVMNILHEAPEH